MKSQTHDTTTDYTRREIGGGVLNGLDLFSGYGGISRALRPWVRTLAYCENNPYRQLALLSEMERNRLDKAPIWDDVSTLRESHFTMPPDVITGGWPCQGHSVAGAKRGLDDERSGLASELLRLIRALRPKFCFLENVPGVFVSGFGRVAAELSLAGYVGRYGVLACNDVGPAWHERQRVWIAAADSDYLRHWQQSQQIAEQERSNTAIARSNGASRTFADAGGGGGGRDQRQFFQTTQRANAMEPCEYGAQRVATDSDSDSERLEGWMQPVEAWQPLPFVTAASSAAWPEGVPEPTLCGKDDGATEWRNQIETLGGGVVPQVAREAFKRLMGLNKDEVKG